MDPKLRSEVWPPTWVVYCAVAGSALWFPIWAIGAFAHPAIERTAPVFGGAFVFGLPGFGFVISWWGAILTIRRRMDGIDLVATLLAIANTFGAPVAMLARELELIFDGWSGPG